MSGPQGDLFGDEAAQDKGANGANAGTPAAPAVAKKPTM